MTLAHGAITEICYVVRNLEQSVLAWADTVGAGPFFQIEATPQEGIYRGQPAQDRFQAALGFSGSTLIEFIEPLSSGPSIWYEALGDKDEAVHHIYPNMRPLGATDYDEALRKYEAAGLKAAWSARVPPMGRTCMIDARARIGCFIELLEMGDNDWQFMNAIHQPHLSGDLSRPLRSAAELFS